MSFLTIYFQSLDFKISAFKVINVPPDTLQPCPCVRQVVTDPPPTAFLLLCRCSGCWEGVTSQGMAHPLPPPPSLEDPSSHPAHPGPGQGLSSLHGGAGLPAGRRGGGLPGEHRRPGEGGGQRAARLCRVLPQRRPLSLQAGQGPVTLCPKCAERTPVSGTTRQIFCPRPARGHVLVPLL